MRELCRAFAACVCIVACVECVVHATATATAAVTATSHRGTPSQQETQKNSTLVHALRRQLMENNYDYMPSESEEPLGTRPLFDQKAINKIKTKQGETTTTAGGSFTHVDKTHLEFDLEFNNPNKEYNNLDIHNNLNTEHDKFDGQFDDHKKEYNNLDIDYTDLKRIHDKIDQEFNKKEFDNHLDRDYAILKKEHNKLNTKFDRDPPNREYDTPYVYDKSDKDFDKSNQRLDDTRDVRASKPDINFMHKKRKTHYDRLNENMKEQLKKHHHEHNNDNNRNEYNKHSNIGEVVMNQFKLIPRADDKQADVGSSGSPNKHIEMEKQVGLLPRAHDESDASNEVGSGTSRKHGVHKNDLLYYMNDERLKQAEENYLDLSNANEGGKSGSSSSSGSGTYNDYDDQTTTTVKYNVFTIRSEKGSRRAGTGGRRRAFVREQRPGEVVVVSLDDAPFPQFRLPAARRQYMHDEK